MKNQVELADIFKALIKCLHEHLRKPGRGRKHVKNLKKKKSCVLLHHLKVSAMI